MWSLPARLHDCVLLKGNTTVREEEKEQSVLPPATTGTTTTTVMGTKLTDWLIQCVDRYIYNPE